MSDLVSLISQQRREPQGPAVGVNSSRDGLASQIVQQRQRLQEAMGAGGGLMDVARAGLRSIQSGQPFGAEFEGIQKQRVGREAALYELLTGEQDRELKQAEIILKQAEIAAKQGDRAAGALKDAIGLLGDIDPRQKAQILSETVRRGQEMDGDPMQVYDLVGQIASGIGLRMAPKEYAPSEFDRLIAAAGFAPGSPEAQEAARRKLAGGDRAPTEAERKITALTARGIPQQDAEDIAYGIVKVVTDPVSRESFLVNVADGTSRPLRMVEVETVPVPEETPAPTNAPPASGAPTTPPPGDPPVLSDLSGFGAFPNLMEFMSRTAGQVMPGAATPETTALRQQYRILRERVLDAYSRSGRPSNYAQQRVEELLPSLGVFESPARAYEAYSALYRDLERELDEAARLASDRSAPPQTRGDAYTQMGAIRQAMTLIGDPAQYPPPGTAQPTPEGNELPVVITDEDYARLPSGTVFIDPEGQQRRKP